MPVTFEFGVLGDTQVKRTLADYAEAAEDMSPLWEKLATSFQGIERRAFHSQGATSAGGWAALSPAYAAWKARAYPGKTILRRTDALYRSLTERPFGVEVIEPHLMRLGTDVKSDTGFDYPRAHQQGTARMPRRRPVVLTEADRRNWVRALQRYIKTAAGKHGRAGVGSGPAVLG